MATKKKTQKRATKRKYVIVRTSGAGVHCGELVSQTDATVTLTDTRRIWRWDTRNDAVKAFTLSDVSRVGAGSGGRVSAPTSEITLNGWHEILPCTADGERALRGAAPWQQ
jgi:hypothetical protein